MCPALKLKILMGKKLRVGKKLRYGLFFFLILIIFFKGRQSLKVKRKYKEVNI